MKNLLKSLVVATFSAIALAPFATAALEKYLPSGNTLALAKIEDFDKLETQSQTNPLAAEFNAKLFTPFLNELKSKSTDDDFAKISGFCSEFSQAFSGELLFAVVSIKNACAPVLIADCAKGYDTEKIAEIFVKAGEKIKSVKIAGVSAKIIESEESAEKEARPACFAVVENKFILSGGIEALRKFIKAVKSETITKEPKKKIRIRKFSESAAFKKARERIGNADFWIYADGKSIAQKIYSAAEAFDKEQADERQKNPEAAMFSVPATPIAKALAPEAVNSIWSSATFTADGAVSDATISWNADKGLVKLLTASVKDGFEKTTLFPPSDALANVSSSNFSLGKFVLQFMSLAREATPMFALVEMQLMNLNATANLDVPATLAALDNGISVYSISSGTPEETVWVQNISDKKRVGFALEKIAEMLAPNLTLVKVPANAGTPEIYNFVVNDETTLSAAFLNGKLCVGTPKMLEKIIAQAAKGTNAPSVWDNADIKAGEARLPAGGYGISYAHLGKSIAAMFAQAQESMGITLPGNTDEDGELIVEEDTAENIGEFFSKFKIGNNDFDYSVLSKTYLGEKEISAKTVIYKNK